MKQIHQLLGQTLFLLPQKAIFWEEQQVLIISDLHLGKSHHFRKGGIAVPKVGDYQNLSTLKGLIGVWKPKKILFVGDLFHSDANSHVLEVVEFMKPFQDINMELIIGNHDIMDPIWYNTLNLKIHTSSLLLPPFLFTHEPLDADVIPNGFYNFCGHVHPGVRLKGKGRQSMTLPCFYFGQQQAILPAFGQFTGTFTIHPDKEDSVYVIVDKAVIKL